jgi:hypothetical protein
MRITSGASTGLAYGELVFDPNDLGIRGDLSGQVVTVAVHMYAPTANTGTPGVSIKDQAESTNQRQSDMDSTTRDGWVWVIATKRMIAPTTSVRIRVHSKSSGASESFVTVDEIRLVVGNLPYKAAPIRTYVGADPVPEPLAWDVYTSVRGHSVGVCFVLRRKCGRHYLARRSHHCRTDRELTRTSI